MWKVERPNFGAMCSAKKVSAPSVGTFASSRRIRVLSRFHSDSFRFSSTFGARSVLRSAPKSRKVKDQGEGSEVKDRSFTLTFVGRYSCVGRRVVQLDLRAEGVMARVLGRGGISRPIRARLLLARLLLARLLLARLLLARLLLARLLFMAKRTSPPRLTQRTDGKGARQVGAMGN